MFNGGGHAYFAQTVSAFAVTALTWPLRIVACSVRVSVRGGESPTDHILKEGSDPPRLSAQTERDPDTRQTGGTGRSVPNHDHVSVGWRGHAKVRRK